VDLAAGAPWIARVKRAPAFGLNANAAFEQEPSYVFADQEIGGQRVGRVTIGPYYDAVQITGHHWPRETIRSSEAIRVVKRADGSALEVRRVARVSFAPTPSGGDVRYTPRGGAPTIPWKIDTVTGEDLSKTQWCRWDLCGEWTACSTDCGPF